MNEARIEQPLCEKVFIAPRECFALHRAGSRSESEWHTHPVGMNLQNEAKNVCVLSNLVLVLF
jgi:hypothetical protein